MDDLKLAVDATLAMLHRNGDAWGNDEDHLTKHLEAIINAAMQLGGQYPEGWDEARDMLNAIKITDLP